MKTDMRKARAGSLPEAVCGRKGKAFLQSVLMLIGLCLCLTMPGMQAEAAARPASHGNVVYTEGNAGFYAADILLLEEKISTIPDRCFDPACYAHTHQWEYCEINQRTHTRHCAECGAANDLTSVHRAERQESDTIRYEGKTYPARRYTCACGYQWSMELSHTVKYEAVDAMRHRDGCVLGETAYCGGYEPSVEEHYAWYYEMEEDDLRHRKICYDCGFQVEEACSFGETEEEGISVCVCGRIAPREEGGDVPVTGEPPEAPDTGEETDAPKLPDAGEEAEKPEAPDTGGEADTPEVPDTGEEAEKPEAPDTGGEAEMPKPPDTGGEAETPETPDTGEEADTLEPPGTGEETKESDTSQPTGTSAALRRGSPAAEYRDGAAKSYQKRMSTGRTLHDYKRRG